MKTWICAAALAAALSAVPASASASHADTQRAWIYGNLTAMATPNFGLTLMPGTRYEFSRTPGSGVGHYFDELFVGPVAAYKFGDFTLRGALWYYYMGYPSVKAGTKATYSHNVEIIPSLEYRTGRFRFLERVILHNTVYASTYSTIAERNGFGTVLRNMVLGRYEVVPSLGLVAAIEPFIGIANDSDAKAKPDGYWRHGLRLNRIYLGFDWQVTPEVALAPQYVYETSWGAVGENVTSHNHYVYVTASYLWKLF